MLAVAILSALVHVLAGLVIDGWHGAAIGFGCFCADFLVLSVVDKTVDE